MAPHLKTQRFATGWAKRGGSALGGQQRGAGGASGSFR